MAAVRPGIAAADLAATLVALTARTVGDACRAHAPVEVVGSGGGMDNPTLRAALVAELGDVPLVRADDRGLPVDGQGGGADRAARGADLARRAGRPGRRHRVDDGTRVLGRISPGHAPLRLPEPAGAVGSLEIVPRGEDSVAPSAPGFPSRRAEGVRP